jgi:hypothetical protein
MNSFTIRDMKSATNYCIMLVVVNSNVRTVNALIETRRSCSLQVTGVLTYRDLSTVEWAVHRLEAAKTLLSTRALWRVTLAMCRTLALISPCTSVTLPITWQRGHRHYLPVLTVTSALVRAISAALLLPGWNNCSTAWQFMSVVHKLFVLNCRNYSEWP